eukprot:TRINITY_DN3518_c0_g3_i2.p1 TRINITY_DN3518_c0_g3~~TRINITY_DN3518_c0_g3_i2.p1  ORF type:complete len:713 (-),score=319.37 TRINITY_DN3518_c0_g3_i2:488-2626(-)
MALSSLLRRSLFSQLNVGSRFGTRFFSSNVAENKLFDKILIANRGEIAVRVMRSCKKLGIKTVAVYSEADVNAMHVRMADEAVCVGPPPSAQSYLDANAILKACKLTGAQAVHPGYGFLSEKANFVKLLEENGVVFIGPKVHAMHAMGDKIESKLLAKSAKVNVIPGFAGVVKTDEEVVRISREIGYPVMIKASAGGGGKGMRIARNDKEAISGFHLSSQEAASSFADDRVFIEKYIEQPRHIEFQILGDGHGNAIYLNERECSIQRRNQKVIEEAPSTFLTPELRRAMGQQAVSLAQAVGYQSAGTVEFLVDKNRNFYFLEMNTRLQVEHPITEKITGVDLVEQMIRVAAGQKLSITQNDIGIKGWALESRVYAEDPLKGFLPSIGRLKKYIEPRDNPEHPGSVRCDSGIVEGSDISIYYDPMICKLVTYGKNRDEAVQHMRLALDSYVIRGVTHNVNFLRSLCEHPRFLRGDLTTAFIPEEYPNGYKGHALNPVQSDALVGTSAVLHVAATVAQQTVEPRLDSFNPFVPKDLVVSVKGGDSSRVHITSLNQTGPYSSEVSLSYTSGNDEKKVAFSFNWDKSTDLIHVTMADGQKFIVQLIEQKPYKYTIQHIGTKYEVTVMTPREDELFHHTKAVAVEDSSKSILSPMPGALFAVKVNVGDMVTEGQEVCVVEAMKMQNAILSPRDGKVKKVNFQKGATLAADDVIIEFE